jgi:manganese-dependent inorganic pyrophosphatase
MIAGIISDTLFLRSPTATRFDRETLEWLGDLSKTDIEEFASRFFEVGSALRSCDARQVLSEDCKEFEEHGLRFAISQIEEIGFDLFWTRKEELAAALGKMVETRRLDFAALLVTDVVSNGSLLLLSHFPETWGGINFPRLERNLYQLDGVVSRKKQLLPFIARLIRDGQLHPQ